MEYYTDLLCIREELKGFPSLVRLYEIGNKLCKISNMKILLIATFGLASSFKQHLYVEILNLIEKRLDLYLETDNDKNLRTGKK